MHEMFGGWRMRRRWCRRESHSRQNDKVDLAPTFFQKWGRSRLAWAISLPVSESREMARDL